MTEYWLDTNHASRLMANDPAIITRIQQSQGANNSYGISVTVLAELYYAVYASQRRVQNTSRLNQLVSNMLLFPFDVVAAEEFGRLQAE